MKHVFTTKHNGSDVELCLMPLTSKQSVEAQLIYNKAWREAEEKGSVIVRNIDTIAERQGLWDSDKSARVETIEKELLATEKKLRSGANGFTTVDEARAAAIKMRHLRQERLELMQARNQLYQYTAESHADNVRLQYIIAVTTKYNNNNAPFFKGLEDLMERSEEESSKDAAINYFKMITEDQKPDDPTQFYENVFLKKNNFVNDDYRLVDSKGRYITEDGKLINKEYEYVLEDGRKCDVDGTPIGEDNQYDIEYKDFGV